ncbi:hypothetical protein Aduo_006031 [Ancylostoma duodenale]
MADGRNLAIIQKMTHFKSEVTLATKPRRPSPLAAALVLWRLSGSQLIFARRSSVGRFVIRLEEIPTPPEVTPTFQPNPLCSS